MERAFKLAGADVKVSEACTEKTDYVEPVTGGKENLLTIATELDRGRSNLELKKIRERRKELKADIGILLVSWPTPRECGQAAGIGVTPEHAFAVVNWTCVTNVRAYLHEIGHLLGAYHEDATESPLDARAFVKTDNAKPLLTVMARPQVCGINQCGPIAQFSNPYDNYRGQTIGEVGRTNNARVIVEGLRRAVEFGENLTPAVPSKCSEL
jgi:hypothetical protein